MPDGLRKFVEEWRDKGVDITDGDADDVYRHCLRKMEVAKVKNPDEYIFLLFPDELKNFLFRMWVNANTELMMIRREAGENVFSLQTDTVPSTMPQCTGTGTCDAMC